MSAPSDRHDTQLTSAAGWVELTGHAHLEVVGRDRATFLQGFCTADVKALATGRGVETFAPTHQGKTLGHGALLASGDRLTFLGATGQNTALAAHWSRFVISEDAEFLDRTASHAVVCVAGPQAGARLARLTGGEPPAERWRHNHATVGGATALLAACDYLGAVAAWLLVLERSALAGAAEALAGCGVTAVSAAAFHAARVEAGYPWWGVDFGAENLPQELARDAQAINFRKGCYLGQETIARIDALGHVNRVLAGVAFAGDTPPPLGTVLSAEGKAAGAVTSSVWSPALGRPLALALLRRAATKPGTPLESPCGPAEVVRWPRAG